MADTQQAPAPQTTALAKKEKNPFMELFSKYQNSIQQSLPKHITPERMIRLAANMVSANSLLAKCTPTSLVAGLIKASQLGIELGVQNQGWLVPFKNKSGQYEAILIIGYQGLCDLARRSGEIKDIRAYPVYENDSFTIEYGLEDKVRHIPTLRGDPGELIGFWAKAVFKDGSPAAPKYMTVDEVQKVRRKSKAPDSLMWTDNFVEGGIKTLIRNYLKLLPMSVDMQEALDRENANDAGEPIKYDVEAFVVEDAATSQELQNANAQTRTQDKKPALQQQMADAREKTQRAKQQAQTQKPAPPTAAPEQVEQQEAEVQEEQHGDAYEEPAAEQQQPAQAPAQQAPSLFPPKAGGYSSDDSDKIFESAFNRAWNKNKTIVLKVMKENGYSDANDLPNGDQARAELLTLIETAFNEAGV